MNKIISLDVGTKRIGVAVADTVSKLPRPIGTVQNDDKIFITISDLVAKEGATLVVVGLPRGLDGQETAQTQYTRNFAADLESKTNLKIRFQDEALTTHLAEEALRGNQSKEKVQIDALAAAYILDDYLMTLGS